jgi:hypothetical protein
MPRLGHECHPLATQHCSRREQQRARGPLGPAAARPAVANSVFATPCWCLGSAQLSARVTSGDESVGSRQRAGVSGARPLRPLVIVLSDREALVDEVGRRLHHSSQWKSGRGRLVGLRDGAQLEASQSGVDGLSRSSVAPAACASSQDCAPRRARAGSKQRSRRRRAMIGSCRSILAAFGSAVETRGDPVAAFCYRDGGKTVERLEEQDVEPGLARHAQLAHEGFPGTLDVLAGPGSRGRCAIGASGKPTRRDDVGA